MKVITGTVVDGRIEVATDLEDGTRVAILAAGDSGFSLSAEDEAELTAALQEIRSGNFEDGYELLRELKGLSRH